MSERVSINHDSEIKNVESYPQSGVRYHSKGFQHKKHKLKDSKQSKRKYTCSQRLL